MEQYMPKSALVAEIEYKINKYTKRGEESDAKRDGYGMYWGGVISCLNEIRSLLDTLEVKEDNKFELPDIKIKDSIEVSSRMKYIDDNLKPIAEFIMDYASWNLHKDEWNQPVLEVPLFRVLDALVQRGKPYCGG